MEHPAKMDDLGIITPISGNLLMGVLWWFKPGDLSSRKDNV
jgi:hypothetical protein